MRFKNVLIGTAFLVSTTVASAAAQIVTNGGFETGDFAGWTQFGNTGFSGVSGNFSGLVDPFEGAYQAFFGQVGSTGGIFQTLTTTPGATYDLNFFLYSFGGNPNSFDVSWNGSSVFSLSDAGQFDYTSEDFPGLVATEQPPICASPSSRILRTGCSTTSA